MRSLVACCLSLLLAACAAPRCPAPAKPAAPSLVPVAFSELPDWRSADPRPALAALRLSCQPLAKKPEWQGLCAEAHALDGEDANVVRRFFEARFAPHALQNAEGVREGLITGYFEPVLNGSRSPDARFRYPVYAPPADMITVELAQLYPELKGLRLRGRLEGNKLVPYADRAAIDAGEATGLKGRELLWVDDPLALFFLQVQGSGRVKLENGEVLRLGYADQNGHPYRAVGKKLIALGEIPAEKMSMQAILAWAQAHPARVTDLLNYNPSYVFFRELPGLTGGPLGSQGVPLTDGHSLAVDPKHIPLGSPVFIATRDAKTDESLHRLAIAQDTGGAIRGEVRADLFVGTGPAAGETAGLMKQKGRLWVLLPRIKP